MVKIWKHVHNHNPKWKLAWIGTGNDAYTIKLKTLINENGLKNSFYLLGYLEKEDVFNVFKSSKLFLCPDHENGWGLAVSEAMSLGLPVVSFNIDIFGSVYKKGFRSVRIYDSKNFAKEVINILENKKLRKELSSEAISQASEFNLDTVAEQLITFLKNN